MRIPRKINFQSEQCTNLNSESSFVLEPGCGESISADRVSRDWSTFEKVGKMKSVTNFSDLFPHSRFGLSSPTFQYKSAFRILLAAILALEIDFERPAETLAFASVSGNEPVRSPSSRAGPNHHNQPAQLVHGLNRHLSSTSRSASLEFGATFQAKNLFRANKSARLGSLGWKKNFFVFGFGQLLTCSALINWILGTGTKLSRASEPSG